jgi:hypothetical protein
LYFNFFLTFDFGQRENLCLALFPLSVLRFARYQGCAITSGEAVLIAFASIGICLKHYFLFSAICVELFLILGASRRASRREWWRNLLVPEILPPGLFSALLFLASGCKDNYFGFSACFRRWLSVFGTLLWPAV